MKNIKEIGAIALLGMLSACGGGGGGKAGSGDGVNPAEATIHGSCYQAAAGSCNEFVGSGWTLAGVEMRCGLGLADPNPCPSENVIGRCNFMEMPLDADTRTYYYVSSAWQEDDVAFLKDTCENNLKGKFEEL